MYTCLWCNGRVEIVEFTPVEISSVIGRHVLHGKCELDWKGVLTFGDGTPPLAVSRREMEDYD